MDEQQQQPLFDYNHDDVVILSTSSPLSHEPAVSHFNTIAEACQGKCYHSRLEVLAALLGLVGHDVQGKGSKRSVLTTVHNLRRNMVLVSAGDGTMTAGQLVATPHMAALFHLGVQHISGRFTMRPVDPTDFAAVKQIFTAIAAECTISSFLCHDSC